MVDIVGIGYGVDTSGLNKGTAALGSFETANEQADAAVKRLTRDQTAAQTALNKTASAATNAQAKAASMGGSFGGIAAQFQDIGVSLQGGMNPITVALQQGTQIAGQMEMALRSGASATSVLGAAFKSLVSPVSLVSIGLTAVVGLGLQAAFKAWGDEGDDLKTTLKDLKNALSDLKDLGVEVKETDFVKSMSDQFKNAAIDNQLSKIQTSAESLRKSLTDIFETGGWGTAGTWGETDIGELSRLINLASGLNQRGRSTAGQSTVAELQSLATAVANGDITISEFVDQTNGMFNNILQSAPEAADVVGRLRTAMLDAATQAQKAQSDFEQAASGASKIADDSSDASKQAKALWDQLSAVERDWRASLTLNVSATGDVDSVSQMLAGIGAPSSLVNAAADREDQALQVKTAYNTMAQTRSAPAVEQASAQEQLTAELEKRAEAAQKKADAAAKRAAREAASGNAYKTATQSIKDQTAALEAQIATFGMSDAAAAEYTKKQELLNAAKKAGISITPEVTAAIDQEVAAYTKASEKLAEMKQRKEDVNEISQAIFSGITSADSFSDALDNITESLANMALQAALLGSGPFASLFGTTSDSGGAIGSIVSALLGSANGNVFGSGGVQAFAKGGVVSSPTVFPFANGTGLMGEAGAEAIVPLRRLSNGRLGVEAATGGTSSGGRSGGAAQSSTVTVKLGEGLEASILDKAATQSVQIVSASQGDTVSQASTQVGKNLASGSYDSALSSRYNVAAKARTR